MESKLSLLMFPGNGVIWVGEPIDKFIVDDCMVEKRLPNQNLSQLLSETKMDQAFSTYLDVR